MYSNDPCLRSSSCRPRTAGSMSVIALTTVTSELSVLRPPSRIGPWQISDRYNSASSASCTLFVLLGGPPCQLLPQSARREDDGEQPGNTEREECPDKEEGGV